MGQALKKHPGGRPTKYNRVLLDTAVSYISEYSQVGHKVPSIAGLAQVLGTDRETLHRWSNEEDKPEFSNIYRRLMRAQELALINNGLDGTYNSSITKMMLSKHGYSDSDRNQGVTVNVVINDKPVEIAGLTLEHDE